MNTEMLIRDVQGNLYISSSRVSLQNVITAHGRGETPEQIRENFPSLTLAEVYGAIIYYLEHQPALDAMFSENEHLLDEADAANREARSEFLSAMRRRIDAAQSHFQRHEARDDEVHGE